MVKRCVFMMYIIVALEISLLGACGIEETDFPKATKHGLKHLLLDTTREALEIRKEKNEFLVYETTIHITLLNQHETLIVCDAMYSLEVIKDAGWVDVPIEWKEPYALLTTPYVILSKRELHYPIYLSGIDGELEPGRYRLCVPYQLGEDIMSDEWKSIFFEFSLIS